VKINLKFLANPYYIFTVIWTVALLIYLLEWSNLFPSISGDLLVFLMCGILFHCLIGIRFSEITGFSYRPLRKIENVKVMFLFNTLMWIVEFVHGKIPLIEILSNNNYNYQNFGVPTLIVVNLTFNSFLCLYLLHCYLSTKEKMYIKYIVFCIGYFILCFSRGMLVLTLTNMLFLWLLANNKNISLSKIFFFMLFLFVFFFGFGYSGNIRTAQQISIDTKGHSGTEYSSEPIMELGSATAEFRESMVPKEFFWTYLYIASPLSNLQYNVNSGVEGDPNMHNFFILTINEYVFDVLSKHINKIFNIERPRTKVIVENLSVFTTFSESYTAMGWFGLIITLFFMLIFPFAYIGLLGINSPYLPLALSIICSIYLLSFFDNMFTYAGLGLQLIYPLLLKIKDKV